MSGYFRGVAFAEDAIAAVAQIRHGFFNFAFALALATAFPHAIAAQTGPPLAAAKLVVRFSEAKVDNAHGVTTADCMLVSPDGRFHLEHRRQVLPSSTATLKIFESSLDSFQLEQLQGFVKSEETKTLPEYEKRQVFFRNTPWFSSVAVDIGTGESARRIGYWFWDERNAGPDVPAEVKTHWQDSEVALQPLVEWFHGIEALNLPPSNAGTTQCSANEF